MILTRHFFTWRCDSNILLFDLFSLIQDEFVFELGCFLAQICRDFSQNISRVFWGTNYTITATPKGRNLTVSIIGLKPFAHGTHSEVLQDCALFLKTLTRAF